MIKILIMLFVWLWSYFIKSEAPYYYIILFYNIIKVKILNWILLKIQKYFDKWYK